MLIAKTTGRLTGAACLAAALLLGSNLAAFAQSQYSDAPYGAQPDARGLSRMHRTRPRGGYRTLTVTRRAPPIVVFAPAPAPVPVAGPGAIVTAPLRVASDLAALPFRVLNGIFPADGPPPVNFIGAPLAAAGAIVQTPFQIISTPFGGPPV